MSTAAGFSCPTCGQESRHEGNAIPVSDGRVWISCLGCSAIFLAHDPLESQFNTDGETLAQEVQEFLRRTYGKGKT